jgi:putative NADH-flavin reductase
MFTPPGPAHNTDEPERRTMRIAIFGASGRTGRQLVEQAMPKGHQVTAIVRNPDGLPSDLHKAVRLVKADVMDPDAIAPALAGADSVVSALQPRPSAQQRLE